MFQVGPMKSWSFLHSHSGDTKNWLIQTKRNVLAVAPYTDMAEIAWLNECYTKTFAELVDPGSARFKRLDLMLEMPGYSHS